MIIRLSNGNEIEMVRTTQESDIFRGHDKITNTEYWLESWHVPLPTPDEIEQVEIDGTGKYPVSQLTAHELDLALTRVLKFTPPQE